MCGHELLSHFFDLSAGLNLLLNHTKHGKFNIIRQKTALLRGGTATLPITIILHSGGIACLVSIRRGGKHKLETIDKVNIKDRITL